MRIMSAHPAALTLLAAVACRSGSVGPKVITTDSAGVMIVESPAVDVPLPWRLTEVGRIGGADSGAASFTQAGSSTVGTDTLGRIYVLDRQAYQVAVFDAAGRTVRTMGRQGGGPGEFQFPIGMAVDAGGTVDVADIGKEALVRFAGDGSVLPQIGLALHGVPEGRFHRAGDTLVLVTVDQANRRWTQRLRIVSPRDSGTLMRRSAVTSGLVQLGCIGIDMTPPFTPRIILAAREDRIAATAQVPYVVDLYQRGRLVRSVRRSIVPVRADQAAVARLYPEGLTFRGVGAGGKCVVPVAELVEKVGTAESVPLVSDLAMAPDRTLWVQRYTFKDEPPRVDVFSPEATTSARSRGSPLRSDS